MRVIIAMQMQIRTLELIFFQNYNELDRESSSDVNLRFVMNENEIKWNLNWDTNVSRGVNQGDDLYLLTNCFCVGFRFSFCFLIVNVLKKFT